MYEATTRRVKRGYVSQAPSKTTARGVEWIREEGLATLTLVAQDGTGLGMVRYLSKVAKTRKVLNVLARQHVGLYPSERKQPTIL